MINSLLLSGGGIIALWVLNIVLSRKLKLRVGEDDAYFRKVVENGNNLLTCFLGLVGIALSWYVWRPIRWVVLVFFALALLWEVVTLIISIVGTIAVSLKLKYNVYNDFATMRSNLFVAIGSAFILYPTIKYLFAWI